MMVVDWFLGGGSAMRYYELVWVLCGVFISSMPGAVWAQAQAHCSIQVKPIASEVAASSDPAFEVVVRVRDAERLQLTYGSLAQYFGLYVLGPWGWQQPDPAKIRPENWMHQQVSSGKPVTIVADHPFRIRFKLSDYFATDPKHLKPGHYQLNVTFFVAGKLAVPIDSGPISFTIADSRDEPN
jgi:hypothetical protein